VRRRRQTERRPDPEHGDDERDDHTDARRDATAHLALARAVRDA
jgi:hypothetical protein